MLDENTSSTSSLIPSAELPARRAPRRPFTRTNKTEHVRPQICTSEEEDEDDWTAQFSSTLKVEEVKQDDDCGGSATFIHLMSLVPSLEKAEIPMPRPMMKLAKKPNQEIKEKNTLSENGFSKRAFAMYRNLWSSMNKRRSVEKTNKTPTLISETIEPTAPDLLIDAGVARIHLPTLPTPSPASQTNLRSVGHNQTLTVVSQCVQKSLDMICPQTGSLTQLSHCNPSLHVDPAQHLQTMRRRADIICGNWNTPTHHLDRLLYKEPIPEYDTSFEDLALFGAHQDGVSGNLSLELTEDDADDDDAVALHNILNCKTGIVDLQGSASAGVDSFKDGFMHRRLKEDPNLAAARERAQIMAKLYADLNLDDDDDDDDNGIQPIIFESAVEDSFRQFMDF